MEKMQLEKGDVVQLNPSMENFGGMLLIVEDPKAWGCQGRVLSDKDFEAVKFRGVAYLRPTWKDMEFVGRLTWLWEDKEPDSDN